VHAGQRGTSASATIALDLAASQPTMRRPPSDNRQPGLAPDRAEEKVERPILNLRHNVMKITIQYFDGCPHWNFAQKRLKKVLRDVGRDDVEVDLEVIDSPEAAERARFRSSPTFLFDGRMPASASRRARTRGSFTPGCR
jgi:hypothetical protein